jgi:SAM-dependent methyltransferase
VNPEEYEVMARAAEQHWWYLGLRDAIGRSLERLQPRLPAAPRVLDAGCGTGENLRFLSELLAPAYLGGFDLSDQALGIARSKAPHADVYPSDICAPLLHEADLDLVTSLDVIYIPGAERAFDGLRKLVAALRPGGYLLLNLPAYNWLYSEHDVAVHTSQRFTAGEVRRLFARLGLEPALMSYRLCFLFPGLVASRLAHKPKARPERARSDLQRPPSPAVNRFLLGILKAENALIARGVSLPFGGSVFALGRKPI